MKFWPHPAPRCSIQASVSCPSHPFACRRGVASSCCVGRSLSSPLNHRDAGAKHPMTIPRAVPLLPPSLLETCAAPSSLQLPSPAPRRHHALACPCALRGHHQPPPVQLTSSPMAYGQMTSASPPRKAAATVTSLMRLAACACIPVALSQHHHLPLSLLA
jgi:hypothetical protein